MSIRYQRCGFLPRQLDFGWPGWAKVELLARLRLDLKAFSIHRLCSLLTRPTDTACLRESSGHELILVMAWDRTQLSHELRASFAAYHNKTLFDSIFFFEHNIGIRNVAFVYKKAFQRLVNSAAFIDGPRAKGVYRFTSVSVEFFRHDIGHSVVIE